MIIKLVRLTLCFALFYSAQSAAYNEAMCILIKQEMQQNSHNKASRKYRNAERDYKNNCNKPKKVQTQPKPIEPVTIIDEPQPKVVKPAPVIEPITKQVNNTTNEQLNTNDLVPNDIKPEEKQPLATPLNEPSTTQSEPSSNNSNITIEPAATSQTQSKITPKAEPANTPLPLPTATTQNDSSLLLPTLAILVVILLGAIIVIRLRRKKQSKTETMAFTAPPTLSKNIKNNESPTSIKQNKPAPKPTPQILNNEVAQSVVTTQESQPNSVQTTATQQPKSEKLPVKPLQNNLEQNELINSSLEQTQEAIPEPLNINTPSVALNDIQEQKATTLPEDITKSTLEHIRSADDFKEPEIRTFDPNAPLPGEKPMPKKPEIKAEAKPEPKQTQSSNPFANLSLDESWDPNSNEKPKIEEKKRPPKSQALIDAEERAKKLQTKE
ncbi:cell surface protein [Pseudoalteromonas aliena]|uniref:cell surface protein n=1 Tax=Pseudoalteromonas aliena TaxID=247523 RepID=UPI00311DCE85